MAAEREREVGALCCLHQEPQRRQLPTQNFVHLERRHERASALYARRGHHKGVGAAH